MKKHYPEIGALDHLSRKAQEERLVRDQIRQAYKRGDPLKTPPPPFLFVRYPLPSHPTAETPAGIIIWRW